MRVALVFNDYTPKLNEENISIVQKYFGFFPPLSLAWVAGIIRKAGHEVMILDARTLGLTMQNSAEILKKYKPDIVGAMMTTFMFPETLAWLKYLKNELNGAGLKVKVLVGGYNLRIYPLESMSHQEIDFGCLEEAINTVPALLSSLGSGSNDLSGVPGLIWRKNGIVTINPDTEPVDFDKYPNPARDLLPNELYSEFTTQRKNFTVLITAMGCQGKCDFCEAGNEKNKSSRGVTTVLNEIQECYDKYGVREIDIMDYDFTFNKQRLKAICGGIKERKIDVKWACRSRVDSVDREMLSMMHDAGCERIYWGIEHTDQVIVDGYRKGITKEQVIESIRMSRDIGIQNLGFFLTGVPGETKGTIAQNLEFAKQLKLDYVQFSKLVAKPRTKLFEKLKKNGYKDYWAGWVSGKEDDQDLPRPWLTTMTNEELDKLTHWAYIKYHSDIGFLLSHVLRCRSLGELFKKLSAFFEMLYAKRTNRRIAAELQRN